MEQGFPPGGSYALAELIDAHGAAVASDLLAFYGIDLWDAVADVMAGRGNPARLLVLAAAPRPGGMLERALRGWDSPEFAGWSVEAGLMADLWDLSVAKAMAGGKKKPPTYPRPKAVEPRADPGNASEVDILDLLPLPPDVRAAHVAARERQKGGA